MQRPMEAGGAYSTPPKRLRAERLRIDERDDALGQIAGGAVVGGVKRTGPVTGRDSGVRANI